MDSAIRSGTRDTGALLQGVLRTVRDGVVVFDAGGVIHSLNPAAARIFGHEPDTAAGLNIARMMPGLTADAAHDLPGLLAAHYCGRAREISAQHRDGHVFPVELSVGELEEDDERLFVGAVHDLTERRADEQHRMEIDRAQADTGAFYGALLEGVTTYAILILDPEGRITSWNVGAHKLKGYEAEEIVGRHFSVFFTPEDIAQGIPDLALRRAREDGKFEDESLRVRKDGSRFWGSQAISPVRADDGVLLGYVNVTRDISGRKATLAAIHDYVGKLTRSNQELDDFAYIASHDLKEPIRGLSNNARFLLEDYGAALDDGGRKRLNRMTYLCERMESLVDDLLYFSRLGRQELAIHPADLNAIVRDIELMMEATLTEKGVEIVIPEPLPIVTCNVPRVTELLRNLISNAVKYNDKPNKRVEIGVVGKEGPGADGEAGKAGAPVYYVRDNGIGIEARFFNDIFRIFKRLNEEADAVKGTGVGLTFVKKIVERHGGRIWLESEPGAGTTFYFTLQASEGA